MYYLLHHDLTETYYIAQSREDITPPLGYVDEDREENSKITPFVDDGEKWPDDKPYPVFTYDYYRKPCSLLTIEGDAAITKEMKAVMESFNVTAQFFEIAVTVKGKRNTNTTYYRIHHLKPLKFIDIEQADIAMEENDEPEYSDHGDILSIRQLAIKPEVLDGVDLFTHSGVRRHFLQVN